MRTRILASLLLSFFVLSIVSVGFPVQASTQLTSPWYAGGVYPPIATQYAAAISMSITIPTVAPLPDEYYAVLLSTWNSAGSYVQLGFSDNYGVWGLTYSWTSGTPTSLTYHHSSNALALSLGSTYKFDINAGNGFTTFVVFHDQVPVWSLNAPTGGNSLILSNTYAGYAGTALYEEVWQTSSPGGAPGFNFNFVNTYWMSQGGVYHAATWMSLLSGAVPASVVVSINGNIVLVNNHYVPPPQDTTPPTVTNVYINPWSFSPRIGQTTRIFYTLSESCIVTVRIYNSAGTLVRTLMSNTLQSSGAHSVVWNGKYSSGLIMQAGTYTVKIYVADKAGNMASPYPIIKTAKIV